MSRSLALTSLNLSALAVDICVTVLRNADKTREQQRIPFPKDPVVQWPCWTKTRLSPLPGSTSIGSPASLAGRPATSDSMSTTLEVDLVKLRDFHLSHFPGQRISPVLKPSAFQSDIPAPAWEKESDVDDNEELGYYDDGVKRTLTDKQIAIFRHSEVQRLLQHRRLNADLAGGQAEIEAHEKPGQSKQSKRAKENKHSTECAAAHLEEVKLDHGQDGEKHVSSVGQVENQSHYRKTVRCDDGLDELDQLKSNKALGIRNG